MSMMWKKIGIVLLILLVGLIGFLAYLGAFQEVVVQEKKLGPFYFLYVEQTGDYRDLRPVFEKFSLFRESEKDLNNLEIGGIYYDDPAKVAPENQRAEIGLLLKTKELYQKYEKKMKASESENKYLTKIIPVRDFFAAALPYKNMASIFLGIIKAYPKLGKAVESYAIENDLNTKEFETRKNEDKMYYAMEIYTPNTIHFLITKPVKEEFLQSN